MQCIIGQFFLSSKFALHVGANHTLGSLVIQCPSTRLGASEIDSYKFSLLLLEIMHLLVRRGFYHTEGHLLQAIHIAYGILSSHVFTPALVMGDASTASSAAANGKSVERNFANKSMYQASVLLIHIYSF